MDIDFIRQRIKTLASLITLLASTAWAERKAVVQKLSEMRTHDEYAFILDCLLRKKIPDAPSGIFAEVITAEIQQLPLAELHIKIMEVITNPALELAYLDTISNVFKNGASQLADKAADQLSEIMVALCTTCGNRWYLEGMEYDKLSQEAILFSENLTTLPLNTLCANCENNRNLQSMKTARLIVGRDKIQCIGHTKLFCAFCCNDCPYIHGQPFYHWEELVWTKQLHCMMLALEIKGNPF